MARPIPKAILSQASDSLRITGHFTEVSCDSMFGGAKKCPEMNSDSRLRIISLLFLEGTAGCKGSMDHDDIGQKIPGAGNLAGNFFAKMV
jgi:hypothetical protein